MSDAGLIGQETHTNVTTNAEVLVAVASSSTSTPVNESSSTTTTILGAIIGSLVGLILLVLIVSHAFVLFESVLHIAF